MIEGFMEYVIIIFFSIVGFCLGNFLIWRHDQKKKKNRRTDMMANLNSITVKVRTEGLDEALEKARELRELLDSMNVKATIESSEEGEEDELR